MPGMLWDQSWGYSPTGAATVYQGTDGVLGDQTNAYGAPSVVHGKAHLSVIVWVVAAVVGLVLLDRGGFKFVFLAGKG